MNHATLVGKTISDISIRGIPGYSDIPYLDLSFTDGTKVTVEARYGGWDGGKSIDEYPAFISVSLVEPTI